MSTSVDYKVLKSNIIKACSPKTKNGYSFEVNYDKLKSLVEGLELTPVNVGMECKRVHPEAIPFLSEYFEKSKLSWFNDEKYYTVLTFVKSDAIDERCQMLLDRLQMPQEDDPDNDKVHDMSTLVADYPCYFATVVSYRNDSPNRCGKPSYVIVCRANKIVIKSSDYQYNPADMS